MEPWISQLKRKGYKNTPARALLLSVLREEDRHFMSAELLYERCKERLPQLNQSTLYRNLELFEACGFLHRFPAEGKNLFKLACSHHHHHHLICENCARVVSLDYCPSEEMERLAQKHGFSLTGHTLELFGLCGNCRNQNK